MKNDARFTWGIKFRVAMTKKKHSTRKDYFHKQIKLKFNPYPANVENRVSS
jgi:hypothetical protein